MSCTLCPRKCGVDRDARRGVCGEGAAMRVAKIMLHRWEEPCICGEGGAGAIFFSGCSLRCVYCQNAAVSRGEVGEEYSPAALAEAMLGLQAQGADCVDLVTPTHFADGVIEAVNLANQNGLRRPVVWNTSGYETVDAVDRLGGVADIYLTDFKYASPDLAARYSAAPDYPSVALAALKAMVAQTGAPRYENGLLRRGVILRHLVLPGAWRDSVEVLRLAADAVGAENVVLSLMAQYTPDFLREPEKYPELCRRITTYEYNKAAEEAEKLGFSGYFQEREAASSDYTPIF
ncbi:MAG: radical SAM protein [Clostridia bacterium]|nr:radical SAM protein [Clostridia bacterium]